MIPPTQIKVNQISAISGKPIPTKVDPTKAGIDPITPCHSDARAKRGRRNPLCAGSRLVRVSLDKSEGGVTRPIKSYNGGEVSQENMANDADLIRAGVQGITEGAMRPLNDIIQALFGPAVDEAGLMLKESVQHFRQMRRIRFF